MCGFLLGTACLIGLLVTLSRGRGSCGPWARRGWGGGDCGQTSRAPWEAGEHGHHHRGWSKNRWFLRALFERLDTTPGQEKVIIAAVDEMRDAGENLRGEIRKTREDIAKAARSPSFDETVMGEAFARHDQAIETMRKAAVGAMAKIHAVLDERQRERLADIIESGPPFFGGFGPYRRHAG
ncbi:MAG: periplasmic heavy metal sensor [Polyangiaceae bacterium]|nr:periplasmic heavy metal sensor [Polyangiaceae bacterium]NUQ74420.1 periplasmic heavy metal sensor [Polyangiaceae bacterium]